MPPTRRSISASPRRAGKTTGTIKSAIGLGQLLWMGIGDTLRVSLSAPPEEEVKVGFEILKSLGLRHRGVNIISCPSCARQGFDVIKTVSKSSKNGSSTSRPPCRSEHHRLRRERPGRGADDRCRLDRRRCRIWAWSIWAGEQIPQAWTTRRMVEHIVEQVEKEGRRDRLPRRPKRAAAAAQAAE